MIKKQLVDTLEEFDDDDVVICMDLSGVWDNICGVAKHGSAIAVKFGSDRERR